MTIIVGVLVNNGGGGTAVSVDVGGISVVCTGGTEVVVGVSEGGEVGVKDGKAGGVVGMIWVGGEGVT